MKELITVRDMLKLMESGSIFSIRGNTYSRRDKSGGELYHYPECQLLTEATSTPIASTSVAEMQRPLTAAEQGLPSSTATPRKRNPNHRQWYTRNVRICQAGQPTGIIHKIYPPLIQEINGKTVVP